MIVLHAADFPAPYGGNFIASLCALSRHCVARGWRQVLVLPEAAREKEWCQKLHVDGHEMFFLDERGSRLAWARSLYQLARDEDRAIIHTHFTGYDVSACMAQLMLRAQGTEARVVWHAHSDLGEDSSVKRRFKNLLKYRIIGTQAFGIAASEHVEHQLVTAGFSSDRLKTVPNGIDASRLTVRSRSRAQVLRDFAIDGDDALLLLFGWDPKLKGVDTALAATEGLLREGFRVTLGLVGSEALQEYVRQKANGKIPGWVRLLPPVELVGDYYEAAALYISASQREGLPYSVCEAMAYGIPVVLSDIPAQVFARTSKGAVFFLVGDAAGLKAALRTALGWSTPERAAAIAENKRLIASSYDVAAWARQVVSIYGEVTS